MNRHPIAFLILLLAASATAEPGRALIDERWADGLAGWTVSNLNDIVSVRTRDGVLRASNDRAPGTKDKTFFTIRSGLREVRPGEEFVAIMESRGNLDSLVPVTLFRAKENQLRSFLPATAVLWYGADRQPLLAQDPTGAMLPTGSSFAFKDMGEKFVRTLHFGTVPEGAAFAALQIGGYVPQFKPGKWLELRRLGLRIREGADGDWDFGDVTSPVIERVSASPDPDPHAPFVFVVKDESAIVKLDVKLNGSPLDPGRLTSRPVPGGTEYAYAPDPAWTEETVATLDVVATDAAGNRTEETLAQFCGEPPKGPVWTVRDDGVVLRDGKPFFPIGTYCARLVPVNGHDPERLFAEFSSNGLNVAGCLYTYRTGEKCLYDSCVYGDVFWEKEEMQRFHLAARRHGVNLWLWPTSYFYPSHCDPGRHQGKDAGQECVDALRYYRDCPEVMCYYLGDDTASHATPSSVRRRSNLVRAIDPLRLTMQADANDYAGRYEPFAKATDVFAQEIYPFRNAEHEPNGLSQVIKDCALAYDGLRRSGARNRSIWTIPQAFSGDGLWHRYPSRALVRAQTFLAVIHGCRGVIYYNYWAGEGENSWGKTPERRADLYSVTRDLAAISGDLTSRDANVQPTAEIVEGAKADPGGYTSVSCLLKDGADGKGPLLLTASSLVYGSVKARIRLGAARVETLFEGGRAPDFRDGVLTDTFGPGEVHVYRLVDF